MDRWCIVKITIFCLLTFIYIVSCLVWWFVLLVGFDMGLWFFLVFLEGLFYIYFLGT